MKQVEGVPGGTGDIRVLDKALDIVLLFNQQVPQLGPTEVAERLRMPRSTAHRVMLTLARRGFLERDELTGRYRLGAMFLLVASQMAVEVDLRRAALPFMRELQAATGEAVNLNIVYQGERVCIEKIDSQHALRAQIQVGMRTPLYAAASSRALLAFMSDVEQERVLQEMAAAPDRTAADVLRVREDLERIRRVGYVISSGEVVPGVASVAAPVRDFTGKVVASISSGGPATRYTPERMPFLIEETVRAARLTSARLGHVEGR